MNVAILLFYLLNVVCIGALPFFFFKSNGKFNAKRSVMLVDVAPGKHFLRGQGATFRHSGSEFSRPNSHVRH